MTPQEIDDCEEVGQAFVTEKGIRYARYSFVSKETKRDAEGKMQQVTMTRLHEKNSLLFEAGVNHISHQGQGCFYAVCFNADMGKLKTQAETLRAVLLENAVVSQ